MSGIKENVVKPTPPDIDPLGLKEILAHYPTGVTIVCSLTDEDQPVGCTVSSFSAVSLDPPLVLFSLKNDSPSLDVIRSAGQFSISVLGAEHGDLAYWFARWREDKFSGISWSPGGNRCPILDDAVAYFECELWRAYDGGDHRIIVGSVRNTGLHRKQDPLVIHRGEFKQMVDPAEDSDLRSGNGPS
jgi:3-hydroxy-9,10-secoandrosta-1,3,5(10)-triene-9,17-dione monooxygenase reductase component